MINKELHLLYYKIIYFYPLREWLCKFECFMAQQYQRNRNNLSFFIILRHHLFIIIDSNTVKTQFIFFCRRFLLLFFKNHHSLFLPLNWFLRNLTRTSYLSTNIFRKGAFGKRKFEDDEDDIIEGIKHNVFLRYIRS